LKINERWFDFSSILKDSDLRKLSLKLNSFDLFKPSKSISLSEYRDELLILICWWYELKLSSNVWVILDWFCSINEEVSFLISKKLSKLEMIL
jgi:hypothetical protein